MGEWLKPAVLKTVSGVTRSGVRIPLPPPFKLSILSLLQVLSVLRECQISTVAVESRPFFRQIDGTATSQE